jgi:UPF0755 protein
MSSGAIRIVKWAGAALLLVLLLLAGAFLVLRSQYADFLNRPLHVAPDGQVFVVEPGMTGKAVIQQLQDLGITRWDWQWRLLMRQQTAAIRTGEYLLQPGLTAPAFLHKLQAGEVIYYRFTIVEGWTVEQLLQALQADPLLGESPGDAEGLRKLAVELASKSEGISTAGGNPEGWFLPETYQFARGYTAADLLQRAHQEMQAELMRAWEGRVTGHPAQTPYELLVLASIIERETAVDSERAEISGVFVRRLLRGMRLQTDPTVIYGMGDAYDGNIRKADLQTDTPYNTYTRHGLPPTPIALPGVASLQAAAQPKEGSSLYFVANGQGGHTFSDTLEEHQKAVNLMLARKP